MVKVMTDQLISFETAKLAKEKGFNQVYLNLATPELVSQSLLQRWLREVHKIYVEIHYERGYWAYILNILPSDEDVAFAASGECEDGDLWLDASRVNGSDWFYQEYKSYEEALEAGLVEALTIVTKPF